MHNFRHIFTHSPTHPLTHSLTHSLTHPPTHYHIHTHSRTHMFSPLSTHYFPQIIAPSHLSVFSFQPDLFQPFRHWQVYHRQCYLHWARRKTIPSWPADGGALKFFFFLLASIKTVHLITSTLLLEDHWVHPEWQRGSHDRD